METMSAPDMTANEETAAFAMLNAAVLSLIMTFGLIQFGIVSGLIGVSALILADLCLVFLVTPRVAARWLGADVDRLLNLEDEQ